MQAYVKPDFWGLNRNKNCEFPSKAQLMEKYFFINTFALFFYA